MIRPRDPVAPKEVWDSIEKAYDRDEQDFIDSVVKLFREKDAKESELEEFNPHHDKSGRFAKTSGSKSNLAMPSPELRKAFPNTFFNFAGLPPTVVKDAQTTLTKLGKDYPEAAKRLRAFGTSEDMPVQALAGYNRGTQTINLGWPFKDESKLNAVLDRVATSSPDWWPSPRGSTESIITHEFGHHINHMANRKMSEKAGTEIEFQRSLNPQDAPSRYGKENQRENFAENFLVLRTKGKSTKGTRVVQNAIQRLEEK